MRAEMAVPGTERRTKPVPMLCVERVEQPPCPREHRRGVAKLDPVDRADLEQAPRPCRGYRCAPGGHEGVGDHRESAGVMDRVNGVLNRHVHTNLLIQEEADDVNTGRERRGDLLPPDDPDTERRAGFECGTELRDGVVIRDAEHVELDGSRSANQFHGADHSVAREGVRVDLRHPEPLGGAHASIGPLPHRVQCSGALRVR